MVVFLQNLIQTGKLILAKALTKMPFSWTQQETIKQTRHKLMMEKKNTEQTSSSTPVQIMFLCYECTAHGLPSHTKMHTVNFRLVVRGKWK